MESVQALVLVLSKAQMHISSTILMRGVSDRVHVHENMKVIKL